MRHDLWPSSANPAQSPSAERTFSSDPSPSPSPPLPSHLPVDRGHRVLCAFYDAKHACYLTQTRPTTGRLVLPQKVVPQSSTHCADTPSSEKFFLLTPQGQGRNRRLRLAGLRLPFGTYLVCTTFDCCADSSRRHGAILEYEHVPQRTLHTSAT